MRRFRHPELRMAHDGERIALAPEASHHLLHVLRFPTGKALMVFDGLGLEAPARLIEVDGGAAVLVLDAEPRQAAPPSEVHLILGIPKGPALDLALRMATEAGVTHIHPVLADRSVARNDKEDRWRRILVEAAQQSGRPDVPTIGVLKPLREVLPALPQGLDLRIALPGAAPLPRAEGPVGVVVGPEGGFTDAELKFALKAGCVPHGLGRFVLRSDTAAAVAVASVAPL